MPGMHAATCDRVMLVLTYGVLNVTPSAFFPSIFLSVSVSLYKSLCFSVSASSLYLRGYAYLSLYHCLYLSVSVYVCLDLFVSLALSLNTFNYLLIRIY